MAATLLGALTVFFQGNPTLAQAVPGSPWLDEAREGITPPYVIVTEVREESDAVDLERENEVQSTWTFRVVGVGEAATEALATQIDAGFDWSDTNPQAPLVVTNRTLLSVVRRHYSVALDRTRSDQARRVTEVRLTYEARWEEAVP